MKYNTQLTMGSRQQQQQTSTRLQDKAVPLRGHRVKKSLDYSKMENPLYVGQQDEHTARSQPVKTVKDDGPVKHMKNLPQFLQRVEKGYNVQGKALNFGVLDWGRLENWKSNEKRVPPKFNTSNPAFVESRSVRLPRNKKKTQQTPKGSPFNSSSKGKLPPGVRWPRGKPVKPQSSDISACSVGLVDQMTPEKKSSCSVDDINLVDDHLIDDNPSRLSNCYSPGEFDSTNPFSDVPHSCPFPLPLSADVESPSPTPVTPLKRSDVDTGKRSSSPNRRFSFSLGKMARSFSFKESSSNNASPVPQLNPAYMSVRSGPVNFQSSSPDSINHNRSKSTSNTPSRSSPLRRLLDPLLKLKGSQLDEKVQKPNVYSVARVNEKHRLSNVQALLQLTLKNGIPFFKLVVERSSDILAAAVNKLPSGKDDTNLVYTFYSVHETKKKSGAWIYQSSKDKSHGFGYNIVGQMKISSSYHAEFSGPERDLYVVRESVLYKTDEIAVDEELAAIIVKNPSDDTCRDIGSCKSAIAVLPEGVHSWPNGLSPYPLINRWRSGGACDCGGWDIGCQFRILSQRNEVNSISSCLDLSFQVGKKKNCSFRLVSVEEGLYSLEYDPSMSMLQAFSICVAVVSSQKLTHIFQVNYVPESNSKELSENMQPLTSDKNVMIREGFVSKPPASPVGRV